MTGANEKKVRLSLTIEEAEHLSAGMADLLCWCRGYMAAAGDNSTHNPIGVEETRTLRIKLKQAIEDAEDTQGIF